MALIIGIVSQKGGVGKSTLSRALASEYAKNEWEVKIADMDLSQSTVTNWNKDRLRNDIQPRIYVEQYSSIKDVEKQSSKYDLTIIDGAPASNKQTLNIAKLCDFIILPTKVTLDDLRPQIKLAHELRKNNIKRAEMGFVLSMVGKSNSEATGAREYIEEAGYNCLGVIFQKDSIGQAHDMGKAANETPFASVNASVDTLIQSIVNHIQSLNINV